MPNDSVSVIREGASDLRGRCDRLRDSSRDLRLRSRECRVLVTRVADGVGNAAASVAPGRETSGTEHLARLIRAEADLQTALAECGVALDDVRRELRRQDVIPSTNAVH